MNVCGCAGRYLYSMMYSYSSETPSGVLHNITKALHEVNSGWSTLTLYKLENIQDMTNSAIKISSFASYGMEAIDGKDSYFSCGLCVARLH